MWMYFPWHQNGEMEVIILLVYECHKSIIFICPSYETNEGLAPSFSNCLLVLCILCGNVATHAEYKSIP